MNDIGLITIGIGILLSMIYDWRTGLCTGGLISAGTLALSLHSPIRVAACIGAAIIIWPALDFAVKRFGLHGQARIGWAMVGALLIRFAIGRFIQPVPWIGWVIPGLIAADIQDQGICETLSALTSVTVLTALISLCLFQLGSVL